MGKNKKNQKNKKIAIKSHQSTDQLLIYANYIVKAFEAVFSYSDPPIIDVQENIAHVTIVDMALIVIQYHVDGTVMCIVSIHDTSPVLLVAELMCILKDIFKNMVHVNEDTYYQDEANSTYIWGREAIDHYQDRTWGRKVDHTVMFMDDLAGHS